MHLNLRAAVSGATLLMATLLAPAHASSLSLDLSDDAVRLQYASTVSMSADSEFEWDAGFLLVEGDNGDSDRKLFTGTLRSVGDAGVANHQVNAALGLRASWLNGRGFDAQALGVGGEVSARLQGMDRLVFAGYGYYAPKILSFGDAEEFFEFGASAGYQVLRNGEVFLGYRRVTFDPKQAAGTVTADTGFHVGIKFGF
jgi:hypothetical protein